ncbi:MAG: hypothetical protein IKE91_07005 [Clostridia bacterium]|nr:hypothetical protein [Clostridia bacterium]
MAERISRQDLLRVCRDVARDFPAVQHVVTEEGAYFSLDLKVYNNFAPEVRNWIWRCELEMRNLMLNLKYRLMNMGVDATDSWKAGGNWQTIPEEFCTTYTWTVFPTENGQIMTLN